MLEVSFIIAISAGALSFFSPCVLPLIPAYITYLTGTMMEDELESRKWFTLTRTFGFILGFTMLFIVMGISASLIGRFLLRYRPIFTKVSGALIICFGLYMIGLLKLNFLSKERRLRAPKITNWFSSVAMGMAFAFGWTPCVGVVLGSILVYAGTSATVSKGAYLLLAYSTGLAIPFIITALLINKFSKFLLSSEKVIPYVMKIGGIIMVVFGLFILLDKMYLLTTLFS